MTYQVQASMPHLQQDVIVRRKIPSAGTIKKDVPIEPSKMTPTNSTLRLGSILGSGGANSGVEV